MIRWQRSIRTARGRNNEAIQWAKEVTDYVNSIQPKHKAQAFSLRFGDLGTLVWQADFDDLAALDKFQQAIGADQGYWDLVTKSTELFIEGTVHDTVYETL